MIGWLKSLLKPLGKIIGRGTEITTKEGKYKIKTSQNFKEGQIKASFIIKDNELYKILKEDLEEEEDLK